MKIKQVQLRKLIQEVIAGTNKVVYNSDYGGFGLSKAGKELYKQLSGQEFQDYDAVRHDPFFGSSS